MFIRSGPTWEQFLDALHAGRWSAWFMVAFLALVVGMILVKEMDTRNEKRMRAAARVQDDPDAREWLGGLEQETAKARRASAAAVELGELVPDVPPAGRRLR